MTSKSNVVEDKQPLALNWTTIAFFITVHALAMLARAVFFLVSFGSVEKE